MNQYMTDLFFRRPERLRELAAGILEAADARRSLTYAFQKMTTWLQHNAGKTFYSSVPSSMKKLREGHELACKIGLGAAFEQQLEDYEEEDGGFTYVCERAFLPIFEAARVRHFDIVRKARREASGLRLQARALRLLVPA